MESTREYQPDGSGNAPAKEQDHIENLNDEVFEVMLSDKFQEEFDKHMQTLSKDDTSRAEANFRMGGQFHLHYLKTGSLASLDHAIRYMERTLREIPSSHDRLKTYVAVYTDLLRQRVLKMQVADSVDAYISGIRLGISLLNECTLKEEQRRQLGCAYVSRYWETKEVEFLKLAIDTLEICFENPPKIFPQAAVYLGAVYAQRYEIDDQLDDLTRSVEILRKGLEATPMGHPQSAELIDFGMSHLTSASKVAVYAPCSLEQREQIISNIDQTLSCVTVDNKQTALIKAQRQLLHECNKGAQERSKILYGVGQQFFDKWKSSQNVRMLDRAIQVVRAALDGLPASHTDGAEYADTLIYYTQTKATVFPGAQTTEEYITAVETAVNTTTQQDSVHDGFVQRLAWAYWARFELSRTDDDLNQVIDYINELLDGGNQLLPQTELILGEAFHARFESTKTADNLEKALSLLENALKFSEAGRPVRHIFLQRLVAYSLELLHARPEPDIQRLIVNAKFVIPELPESDTKDEVRSTLSRAETTIELLSQREMLNSVFKTLGDLKLNDKSGPKPIGKTFVPHALYESYKIGASEIRTLELMSGEPDEDIICKLHTVALTDQVKYEALSYTWGDPDKISEIAIADCKCKVTVNLTLALRGLRQKNTSRMLWVDAVCINQQDNREKSRQVAMMGEIYKRASQVLTWLGEPKSDPDDLDAEEIGIPVVYDWDLPFLEWGDEPNDVSLMRRFFTDEKAFRDWPVVGAFSILSLLAKDCHLDTLPFFRDPRYPDFDLGIYPSDLWQKSCQALNRILENSYWSRVWIVQEIVLGVRVKIHYGRHIVALETLIEAGRSMRKHYYGCCYKYCAAKANNRWSHLHSILGNISAIEEFGRLRSSQNSRDITHLSDTLLGGIDFREATDPRDQIYGLLGLVPDHRDDKLLRPDYTLPVAQVYTRAVFKIMRNSGDLRMLSCADRLVGIEGLPSWCYDFAEKSIFTAQPYDWDLFSACKHLSLNVDLKSNSRLEVRGFHLDVINSVSESRTPESLSREAFLRWIEDGLRLAKKRCATENCEYRANSPIPIDEAYWRTLIGDTFTEYDGSKRRATHEDIQLLYDWLEWMKESVPSHKRDWAAQQPPEIYTEISSTFMAKTQSRKLFTTENKRLGMGVSMVWGQEKEVLTGDQVWLLQGSNLPVILRKISSETEQPHYALVSMTYIHGIMDGEACPSIDKFTDIILGQYPVSSKAPNPANEAMRNALRMSLLLGHGSRKINRGRSDYAPKASVKTNEARTEKAEDVEMSGEAWLFPEGRKWPGSIKPIPQHRVFIAALLKDPPATEAEWEEFERDFAQRLGKSEDSF